MFVVSDEDDVDGMQDAGVALVRAYNYISDEVDSQSAFEAVIAVSRPFTNGYDEVIPSKWDTSDSKNSRQAENDSLVTDVCLISVLPKSLPPYIVLDVQPGSYRWTVERWGRGESAGEEVPLCGGQQRPGGRLQLRQQQKGEWSWMW